MDRVLQIERDFMERLPEWAGHQKPSTLKNESDKKLYPSEKGNKELILQK